MKSWKTSVGGMVLALTALLSAVKVLTDGDPSTTVDLTTLIGQISAGWALFMARDNNVTSEQAGAKLP